MGVTQRAGTEGQRTLAHVQRRLGVRMRHVVELAWRRHGHVVLHRGLGQTVCYGWGVVVHRAEQSLAEGGCPRLELLVWRGSREGLSVSVVKDRDVVRADHLRSNRRVEHWLGEGVCVVRRGGVERPILSGAVEGKRLGNGEASWQGSGWCHSDGINWSRESDLLDRGGWRQKTFLNGLRALESGNGSGHAGLVGILLIITLGTWPSVHHIDNHVCICMAG